MFAWVAEHLAKRLAEYRERTVRLALVHSGGFWGATVAGMFNVVPPPGPLKLFTTRERALAWLRADAPAELLPTRARISSNAPIAPVVQRLRALVRQASGRLELEAAAVAMDRSSRSLQRELQREGTSFRREMPAARVEHSKERMLSSSLPITRIGLEVGFESSQHFSRVFREHTGLAPSEWRARR